MICQLCKKEITNVMGNTFFKTGHAHVRCVEEYYTRQQVKLMSIPTDGGGYPLDYRSMTYGTNPFARDRMDVAVVVTHNVRRTWWTYVKWLISRRMPTIIIIEDEMKQYELMGRQWYWRAYALIATPFVAKFPKWISF